MGYSNIFAEKKVKFLRKHLHVAKCALDYPDSESEKFYQRELVKLARKHLGYSDKTVHCDILSGLKHAWKELKDADKANRAHNNS